MDTLKYVGKQLSPGLQTLDGKPVDIEAFRDFEMKTFEKLFREQIADIVRHSGSLFRGSTYKNISPQFNAFEHLMVVLNRHKNDRLEITNASNDREEFLARVQVRIPVQSRGNEKLFSKPIADNVRTFALVSFYTGVCREFTLLTKENELLKHAVEEFSTPEFLASMRTLGGQAEAPIVDESDINDEAFDPDVAIPEIIRNMRLERRYNYAIGNRKLMARRFYQSLEGYIFRIEIDGYVSVPVTDGV